MVMIFGDMVLRLSEIALIEGTLEMLFDDHQPASLGYQKIGLAGDYPSY